MGSPPALPMPTVKTLMPAALSASVASPTSPGEVLAVREQHHHPVLGPAIGAVEHLLGRLASAAPMLVPPSCIWSGSMARRKSLAAA